MTRLQCLCSLVTSGQYRFSRPLNADTGMVLSPCQVPSAERGRLLWGWECFRQSLCVPSWLSRTITRAAGNGTLLSTSQISDRRSICSFSVWRWGPYIRAYSNYLHTAQRLYSPQIIIIIMGMEEQSFEDFEVMFGLCATLTIRSVYFVWNDLIRSICIKINQLKYWRSLMYPARHVTSNFQSLCHFKWKLTCDVSLIVSGGGGCIPQQCGWECSDGV